MRINFKLGEIMEKERFDDICSKLNIDELVKQSAVQQFIEISRNTILDVSVGRFTRCFTYSAAEKRARDY